MSRKNKIGWGLIIVILSGVFLFSWVSLYWLYWFLWTLKGGGGYDQRYDQFRRENSAPQQSSLVEGGETVRLMDITPGIEDFTASSANK